MWWVIQNNLYSEEGFEKLLAALDRFGLPYSIHKVIPFIGLLEPEAYPPPGPVIVMGSVSMSYHAQKRGWKPGTFLNDNFNFVVQHDHWGDRMLNYDARVVRFADVPEQPVPFFIRPVADSKSFTGEVTDWPSYVAWRDHVLALTPEDNPTLTGDTLVMISTKKEIWNETRTWIVDGRVVTASGYKFGTIKRYSAQVDERITAFAESCAAEWVPDRAFVLDVADTPEGLKIVEINNINSAGFYKADMGKLVMALENVALDVEIRTSAAPAVEMWRELERVITEAAELHDRSAELLAEATQLLADIDARKDRHRQRPLLPTAALVACPSCSGEGCAGHAIAVDPAGRCDGTGYVTPERRQAILDWHSSEEYAERIRRANLDDDDDFGDDE